MYINNISGTRKGQEEKHLVLIPLLFLSLFLVISCSNEPQPISYGHDACNFCEMTIVSNSFAAQAVSSKGKQYKYDSVECLVNHLGQEDIEMENIWVADYQHPGIMIEAQKAKYIINDSLKSPMGANLAAIRLQRTNTLSWEELHETLLPSASPHGDHMGTNTANEKSHH